MIGDTFPYPKRFLWQPGISPQHSRWGCKALSLWICQLSPRIEEAPGLGPRGSLWKNQLWYGQL